MNQFKAFLAGATLALTSTTALAGGILTNTNQSIDFLRNPARDAAIGLDGVYSNPAGVVFMPEGFHLGLNWIYHGAVFADVAGAAAFVTRIRAVILRDTGSTISPFNAWILLQGVESLPLRIERHSYNAQKVVEYLNQHPKVKSVSHPLLPSHPDHDLYTKYFPNGGGSIFTFEIKGTQEDAWKFIDSLQIFSLLANVADVKSLVIHPYTTTHSQLSPEELAEQHITPTTIRLSVGVEHIDDIIADLDQAFNQIP